MLENRLLAWCPSSGLRLGEVHSGPAEGGGVCKKNTSLQSVFGLRLHNPCRCKAPLGARWGEFYHLHHQPIWFLTDDYLCCQEL